MPTDVLKESDRFIITHPRTERNTSSQAFGIRLDDLLRRKMKADYKMGDIFFTSAWNCAELGKLEEKLNHEQHYRGI